jgi:hypothetical protein
LAQANCISNLRALTDGMKLVAIHAAVLVASLSYSEGFKILEDSGPSKTAATPLTVPVPGKKGVGLGDSWGKSAAKTLSALKVFWFYNWGAMNDVPGTTAQYVPMAYDAASTAKLLSAPLGQVILGFNEPDNVKRAVMTPQAALDLWPKVTSLLSPNVKTWLGAPAPAHDPTVAANTWLPTFLAGKPTGQTAGPKVDFITLHWYKGANAQLFMNDVAALYNKYKLPIWITEFCPQDHASAMANPTAYTQPQVTSFITTVIPWLESQPYVQAYAWHDPSYGTCSLFDSSTGGLSATGLVYASATR